MDYWILYALQRARFYISSTSYLLNLPSKSRASVKTHISNGEKVSFDFEIRLWKTNQVHF